MVVSELSKFQLKFTVCGSLSSHLVTPSSIVPDPFDRKVTVLSFSQSSNKPETSTPESVALSNFHCDAVIKSVLLLEVLLLSSEFFLQAKNSTASMSAQNPVILNRIKQHLF